VGAAGGGAGRAVCRGAGAADRARREWSSLGQTAAFLLARPCPASFRPRPSVCLSAECRSRIVCGAARGRQRQRLKGAVATAAPETTESGMALC